MRINLKLNNHIKLLLSLYKIKEGTIPEIYKKLGLSYNNNCLYYLKNDLIKLNVLQPKESVIAKKGRGEGEIILYKINHDAIDQIFFGDLQTSILLARAKNILSGIFYEFKSRNLKKILS